MEDSLVRYVANGNCCFSAIFHFALAQDQITGAAGSPECDTFNQRQAVAARVDEIRQQDRARAAIITGRNHHSRGFGVSPSN